MHNIHVANLFFCQYLHMLQTLKPGSELLGSKAGDAFEETAERSGFVES